ncbi:MAG TPA: 30S ribosomal protein S6 [Bacteroidota bacterium]|nr:30S ribosomal protein S6 [Bacteroidota bacterium]
MNQTKRTYEATFIINASLDDPQIETAITRAQEVITKNGGEINAINRWGRKRLAYTIKKKNNGYYVNMEFTALGSTVTQLERSLFLDENVIRFLTIRLDKEALLANQRVQIIPTVKETPLIPEQIPSIESPDEKEPLFDDETTE